MCFVHDYDWHAEVYEESDRTATQPVSCYECGQVIPQGGFAHNIFMQQHEECSHCGRDPGDCECAESDFGETFECDRCEGCHSFVKAIQAAEQDEGCSPHESLPAMPFRNDLQDLGQQECKRYWKKACQMFPQHKPHFARLWKRIFG